MASPPYKGPVRTIERGGWRKEGSTASRGVYQSRVKTCSSSATRHRAIFLFVSPIGDANRGGWQKAQKEWGSLGLPPSVLVTATTRVTRRERRARTYTHTETSKPKPHPPQGKKIKSMKAPLRPQAPTCVCVGGAPFLSIATEHSSCRLGLFKFLERQCPRSVGTPSCAQRQCSPVLGRATFHIVQGGQARYGEGADSASTWPRWSQ